MKKQLQILIILLIIFIVSCSNITPPDSPQLSTENQGKHIDPDKGLNGDFKNIERNLDVLIEAGNVIGDSHYDELESSILLLENNGIDVSTLKNKLSQLKVANRNDKVSIGMPAPGHEDVDEMIVNQDNNPDTHDETNEEFRETKIRRANSEIPTETEKLTLPDCNNLQFNTLPVDLSDVKEITPRGNLGPPGHTFPTEHSYLHLGEYETNFLYDLFAPADVYITSVVSGIGDTQDPIDYSIWFSLCKDKMGYYNHVKAISDELKAITNNIECEDFSVQKEGSCTKVLLEKVKAGTLLGQVGAKQGNFDFGAMDFTNQLDYINIKRYPTRSKFIACAYDYYPNNLKQEFFNLIKRENNKCGIVMQDIPKTLKGNWFHESANEEYVVNWNVYLAFVNENDYPDVQAVSIAGFITDPSKYKFIPKTSGTTNREFSQVTNDGKIYCYQPESVGKENDKIPTGKILVQLTSDTSLKIEHQTGSCKSSESFSNPEIYNR